MSSQSVESDAIRRAAIEARTQVREHIRQIMWELAEGYGLGDWYRHDLAHRRRLERFRREMAVEAYWGITTRRPIYGRVCGG